MKKRNGFTLIELLAVIVVLAIIMIIALPNVLTSLDTSKQKSFKLFADKIFNAYNTTKLKNSLLDTPGTANTGISVTKIGKDTGVDELGNYEGYIVESSCNGKRETKIYMWDKDYEILGEVQNDNYNLVSRNQTKIDAALAKLEIGNLTCADFSVIDDTNKITTTKKSGTTTRTTTKINAGDIDTGKPSIPTGNVVSSYNIYYNNIDVGLIIMKRETKNGKITYTIEYASTTAGAGIPVNIISYAWSNGTTTRQINVTDNNLYTCTIVYTVNGGTRNSVKLKSADSGITDPNVGPIAY